MRRQGQEYGPQQQGGQYPTVPYIPLGPWTGYGQTLYHANIRRSGHSNSIRDTLWCPFSYQTITDITPQKLP